MPVPPGASQPGWREELAAGHTAFAEKDPSFRMLPHAAACLPIEGCQQAEPIVTGDLLHSRLRGCAAPIIALGPWATQRR
mmetsp:Transcript_117262/g.163145  ORF Transcript_117262/g.163145 Transcript_117262/m.163145 type:complete len:80 (+) Transcript_117262:1496-1735(+)